MKTKHIKIVSNIEFDVEYENITLTALKKLYDKKIKDAINEAIKSINTKTLSEIRVEKLNKINSTQKFIEIKVE